MARAEKRKESRKPVLVFTGLVLLLLAAAVNFVLQIARKPTELLRYMAGPGGYSEARLWRKYGEDFRANATRDMTPEFLAAMAYLESSGDQLAAPAWRVNLTRDMTRIYAPASSAVGLFQFTEETFSRASQYCVRGGKVTRCWFPALKTRLSPSDSTEIAAGYLQHQVDAFLARRGIKASRPRRQRLAAVIHLCGPGKADALVAGKFRPEAVGMCGNQSAAAYVRRIEVLRAHFARLARAN